MKLFIVCVIFTFVVKQGSCIMCYQCDSFEDNKCGDPMSSTNAYPRDCSSTFVLPGNFSSDKMDVLVRRMFEPHLTQGGVARFTVSQCIKTMATYDGSPKTFRGCNILGPNDPCGQIKTAVEGDGGKLEFCETCDTELCNGGQRPLMTLTLIIIVTLRSLL